MYFRRIGALIGALCVMAVIAGKANAEPVSFLAFQLAAISMQGYQQDTVLAPSPLSGAGFGVSVALSGDTAVISAPYQTEPSGDLGVVSVFRRNAMGAWGAEARFDAPQIFVNESDFLGCPQVALDADTLAIGSPSDDGYKGKVAIYVRNIETRIWNIQQELRADHPNADDRFGCVALAGNTLFVGAYRSGSLKGSGYVFVREGTTWKLQAKLSAPDGASGDSFGLTAAVSGTTILVGAPFHNSETGAAYVFSKSDAGWKQEKLIGSGSRFGDHFGASVSVSGDTIAIGATKAIGGGYLHLFRGNGAVWTEQTGLASPDPKAFLFGSSVSISGDRIGVGEMGSSEVRFFVRRGSGWAYYASYGGVGDSLYGASVALSNMTAIVGAPLEKEGRVYILSDPNVIFTYGFE